MEREFTFYLGTRYPNWFWSEPTPHPLFISVRTLNKYKKLKPALSDWCLDSGGFTELSLHDQWVTTPEQYVEQVRRAATMGRLVWASPQDWMCEPHMVKKTGLSVEYHQKLTCENYCVLRQLAPELPFIPVLQGWEPDDYYRHVEMYGRYGFNLSDAPTVGLGSFCRRANVAGVRELVIDLKRAGMRLHGFGLKKDGLRLFGDHLYSSDSMAWSLAGRIAGWRGEYLCGEPHRAKSCGDCKKWAFMWADDVAHTSQVAQKFLWET